METSAAIEGDVLVRVRVADHRWYEVLPPVPEPAGLTVTLGRRDLLPADPDAALAAGYRVVGVATDRRPIGSTVDVLVPATTRRAHPRWWATFVRQAERVFDLRLGPVQLVLAAELDLHTRVLTDGSEAPTP